MSETAINLHLIIHNIISVISTVAILGIGFFTYLNGRRKVVNITWALTCLAVAVFTVSHAIGVNVTDPNNSMWILMFNMSMFFIGAFHVHAVLAMTGKDHKYKWVIESMYVGAVILTIFFIIFPDLFLLPSVPKMYFPNYYNPGILNWIRMAYLYGIAAPFVTYQLFSTYRKTAPSLERSQYKYFMWTTIVGYTLGFIPNFLVYDIPIDPLWGMLFTTVMMIPFFYGAIRYGMLSIEVVAKEAAVYSGSVIVIGGFIVLMNYLTDTIQIIYPNFPMWTISLALAILVVSVATLIWENLRKNDLLKYEFVTTITHKFRTPLTYIKYATENLLSTTINTDQRDQLLYIESANAKLVEFTNLLVSTSDTEKKYEYEYQFKKGNLSSLVNDVIASLAKPISTKHLNIEKNIEPELLADIDGQRIKFVIQVFLENAINYTPESGTVTVNAKHDGDNIVYSVHDSGLGMAKDELNYVFSKFYRGKEARLADTEGMGIGLFISKEIIDKHGGKITADSEGVNKGSTFTFSIPAQHTK